MFAKSFVLISHIYVVKSQQKVFGKGRQDLEGVWTNLQSITFKWIRFVAAGLARSESPRLPTGVRGNSRFTSCLWTVVSTGVFLQSFSQE